MSLLKGEIACQLRFLSSVRATWGITESLWCCPLRAAVASAENLFGPWWRRRRRGVEGGGGLDGAEGGLCGKQESACVMGGGDGGICSRSGRCVKNVELKYWTRHWNRLSSDSRPSDWVMFRQGCSRGWVTITCPAHPKHPWPSDRMVKPVNPPPPPVPLTTALTQPLLK